MAQSDGLVRLTILSADGHPKGAQTCEKDSEAVLGVWLPAPLPTPRALPDRGALWPLAVGVERDLGGIDV